ncbi:phosphoribosylformylglycinamidine synthase I [bacterium]|jgi:phosphoribosylformylglycinamidine synthase subunit PurQ / glutaminase|nr:phosphoribosylformylglycinamidine synthase I [bacterium]
MNKIKIAILQLPGTNCEYETKRCVDALGMTGDIVRWNESRETIESYDGYILPGGFSFQDRVRSGAIAAKLELMAVLEKSADQGKPILGICNGCQILAETGLVPGSNHNKIEMALTYNHDNGKRVGFICDWKYVTFKNPSASLFTKEFKETDVFAIPINHGEGCFIFNDEYVDDVQTLGAIQYCTETGDVDTSYPTNPNGSMLNIAGVSNKKGNVLAMMPHPERAFFRKQFPKDLEKKLTDSKSELGPWALLLKGMKNYIESEKIKKDAG